MNEAVIVAATRSPIGGRGAARAWIRPDDLAAHVLGALVARAGVDAAEVDEVFLGCANQAGEDKRDAARMAALLAGVPDTVPGVTVNRLCGSGLEAVALASLTRSKAWGSSCGWDGVPTASAGKVDCSRAEPTAGRSGHLLPASASTDFEKGIACSHLL